MSEMEKIKDKSKDLDTLNKFSVNQFIIKCRPISSQGKVHVLKRLLQHAKRYRQKKTKKEEEKEKNSRKADRFVQEVMFMKKLHPDDITKFSLLNKKTFKKVGDDPKSSIEERALCRLAEHKSVSAAIEKFRNKYPEWDNNLPDIVKGLGLRHRKDKLKRLQEKGKMDTYLEKEQNSLKILQQVGVLKLDKRMLDHGDKRKPTPTPNSKLEDDLKNRPFNMHLQNKSLDEQKSLPNSGSVDSKNKQNHSKDIHKTKAEDNEEISDEGLGSSEEQQANKSTRLHLEEKETDSEEDIMVAKLGQNSKKSVDNEESSESEGTSDENELEGDEDSDNENEEEIDDSEDDIKGANLGQQTLKRLANNDENEESDDSEDDNKGANLGQTLKRLADNDENEEESDDNKGANLGQTLKRLADNDENEEESDSEDDNKGADLGQTLKRLADNIESNESDGDSNEDNDENESEGDEDSDNEEESDESTDDENAGDRQITNTKNDESENESDENMSKSRIKLNKKAMTQKALKRINKKVSLTKNTKNSRTVEVKTLDLSVVSNIGIENRKQKSETESESEDEEFFKRPNKEGKVIKKKKRNKSSFFLREGDEDNDNESDASEESEGDENYLKRQREDSDDGNIDTGKYFRKNIYRAEPGSNMDRGRGGGRGFDRGGGRGFDRGGGRGFDRGGGRGSDRGGGRGSDRGGGRGSDRGGGRGSDRGGGRGSDRGRGRGSGGGFGERGRPDRNFKNKGNEFNANYIDIDPKKDRSNSANIKGSGAPKLDVSYASDSVHPSWAAKQKLKQQSAALNSFQGKKITFDED